MRFFTVYGPWGRPDMAPMLFADAAINNREISVFNNGNQKRDFTYIDDIVQGIIKLLGKPPLEVKPHHKVFNIGNNNPEKLMVFITTLEQCLSKSLNRKVEFKKVFESIKPGDVHKTYASTD